MLVCSRVRSWASCCGNECSNRHPTQRTWPLAHGVITQHQCCTLPGSNTGLDAELPAAAALPAMSSTPASYDLITGSADDAVSCCNLRPAEAQPVRLAKQIKLREAGTADVRIRSDGKLFACGCWDGRCGWALDGAALSQAPCCCSKARCHYLLGTLATRWSRERDFAATR